MADNKRKENGQRPTPWLAILIAIIAIVVAGYYAFSGNQSNKPVWNEDERRVTTTGSQDSQNNGTATTSGAAQTGSSIQQQTGSSVPPADMMNNTPAGRDARDAENPEESGSEETGAVSIPPVQTGSGTASGTAVNEYWNEALGYGFSLPRSAYYLGSGPRDGAAHSVAIKSGTGATDFESADVKVWYYPKTILPQVSNADTGFYQDPATSRTYLKLGSGSLMIEGDTKSAIVNTIVQTAHVKQ